MPYDTISVTPLSPRIGAEIGNIDLTRPLSNREVQEVHDALLEYQVIFFRDQPINLDAHRDFARHFGELHVHVGGDGTASQIIDGHPEVRRQHFDENSKRVSGEVWHTDQSCAAIPPMASILHQRIVPPNGGGDTLFASMYAAYEELSPRMQKFLEGLTATHDGALAFDKGATTKYPTAIHPVIAKHPETGRKLIFVNRGFTDHINELPHERERRCPRVPLQPLRPTALAGALPLDQGFDRLLGQPLHAALGDLGLLAQRPLGIPRPSQGNRAAVGRLSGPIRIPDRPHRGACQSAARASVRSSRASSDSAMRRLR